MTISTEAIVAGPFTGTGLLATYPFAFKVFADTDVLVKHTSTAGVDASAVLTTDYSVSRNADQDNNPGGTITWHELLPIAEKLTITSQVPNTQGTALPSGGSYAAKTVERMIDKCVILVKQFGRSVTRSLRQPITDTATFNELPNAADRASKALTFDSAGQPIAQAVVPTSGVLATTYTETLLDDTTKEAARITLGFPAIAAKGDLIAGTAANALAVLTVGANGKILMARSAATPGLAYVAALNSAGYGDTWAPGDGAGGGDLVNDITMAAGGCMDSTGAYWITGAAITKQLDAAWAVGSAAGGLDTGAIGNNDYYIWRIARSDTGVTDLLFSLSSTVPTMPANYDFKKLRGWFTRVGGTIVAFHTYETEGGGIDLGWDAPTLDVNQANTLTTARRTDAIKVPKNFSVVANINVVIKDASTTPIVWVCCPDQTDAAPQLETAPLASIFGSTLVDWNWNMRVRTSATGTIAARSTVATTDFYGVSTMGFTWARRN